MTIQEQLQFLEELQRRGITVEQKRDEIMSAIQEQAYRETLIIPHTH